MAYLLHSDFFCSTPWGVIYVLYIINKFLLPFYKKIIPRIIAASNFFLWYMSFILSIEIFTFHTYRIPQFAVSVSSFFENYVLYIINELLHILSQYDTFFNANLHLFIKHHLTANQSVYICYKCSLKWLNKAILSTF